MMGAIIVVDDIRTSADRRAQHCVNTVDALELFDDLLQRGEEIDQLWLDYDLSESHGVGSSTTVALAQWLIDNQQSRTPLIIHNIFVHSRHQKAPHLVEMLKPYFEVSGGELPDRMWWEQPEDNDSDELNPNEEVG